MEWKEIVDFWFDGATKEHWFRTTDKLDMVIRRRFLDAYWSVVRGETTSWRTEPGGRLAEILVLDQFARNIFRNNAQAFEHDSLALKLAEEAITAGADKELPSEKRRFMYMPFMHTEDKAAHDKSIALFEGLNNEQVLRHAINHKKTIDQFGRYPHRNAVLGRESTPEEIEFLEARKSDWFF